jgi:hypothetical protein
MAWRMAKMAKTFSILIFFCTRSADETTAMMTIFMMTALLVSGPTQQYVELYVNSIE